ncbi:MAG: MATE family efflux transporter [Deltaproteobacteria bacterium]|jgi:putative MATE family efflux protein|nr:MATE family efflux transporter [Deltaproteobacteria bacterium]MBW2533454.1 MATE family efflux transporter [Deltaproteobacteria bacterium]
MDEGGDAGSERLERFLASPRRAVWSLALPMIAGMAVHTLYMVVDTAFIGTLGTEALAAATFVAPLFLIMIALTMGLGTAVTALVAQALGRRDAGEAERIAGTAMTLGVAAGLVLTATGTAGGRWLLEALGAGGPIGELSWSYFQIIVLLVPLWFVSIVFRSVLTGEGDAKTPMLVLTGATVTNIALDALFILVLGLGLRGAALATGAAQLLSLTAYVVVLLRRDRAFVRFRIGQLLPARRAALRLSSLAVPAAAGMLVMSAGGMLYNRLLAEFGQVAVAAYGAATKIDMLVAMPLFGLAGAAVSVVGMFAGARRADLVRSTALYTYGWAVGLASAIGATAYLSSGAVLQIFTADAEAIDIGQTYLGYMLFAYPMMAIGITTGRLLQGLGRGLPPLVITAVRVLLVGVPIAYAGVYLFDAPVEVIWSGMLAGGVLATLLALGWVRRTIWLHDPTAAAARRDPGPVGEQSVSPA